MSPPAQKARLPCPRARTHCTDASPSHSRSLASSACAISSVSALSASGRFSTTRAMPSRTTNSISAIAQEAARHDHAHDLVGAFENLVHAQIAHKPLDRQILEIAVPAVKLERLVADGE